MSKEEKNLTLHDLISEKTEEAIEEGSSDLVSLIAISELTNVEKIKLVSRLKQEQISTLTKLELFADTFDIPFMKSLANNIMQLQVSLNGYGRRELVSVVRQSAEEVQVRRGLFGGKKEVFR